jgi:hypothetical protein
MASAEKSSQMKNRGAAFGALELALTKMNFFSKVVRVRFVVQQKVFLIWKKKPPEAT